MAAWEMLATVAMEVNALRVTSSHPDNLGSEASRDIETDPGVCPSALPEKSENLACV